jgi:pilus assembly protein CpaB
LGFRVMKLARVAVLGVAGGAGLLAAILALNLSAPEPAPVVQSEAGPVVIPTEQVLVATKDITLGKKIDASDVTWTDWPKSAVNDKLIVQQPGVDKVAELSGALARASFYAGEPISEAKLIHTDQGIMAALLPKGMRAVATRISADTGAGGFILPNDRVDVIMTRQSNQNAGSAESGGGNAFLTETILSNVRVLAIDQVIEKKAESTNPDGTEDASVIGTTATLELTPQQAQILSVAQQMSDHLTLALRSMADSTPGADTTADAIHLIGGTKRNGAVTVVRNGVARDVTGIR